MAENVKVTLHLTPEAARILHQYAGDRNRGFFVSQLLVAQRRVDDLEKHAAAVAAKQAAADKALEAASNARSKFNIPTPGRGNKKRR